MGSFKDYMTLKNDKLDSQNHDKRFLLNKRTISAIFKGVSVYITGFTDPPNAILKEMILQNGGSIQMYFRRTAITHIIASNLPEVKKKLWKNYLVVEPCWIVDCVNNKKLLPVAKYILYRQDVDIKDIYAGQSKGNLSKSAIPETTSKSFVDEFYNKSRLHHLSSSASELKHYVCKLQEEFHPHFIPTNTPQTNMVVVHIDIDCFFVSIALRKKPHLRGLPVCVTHGTTGEKVESFAEISSCSYEARSHGVRNGMFMGKALSLCPNLVTVPYEFKEYQKASHDLYRILVNKTPKIEVVSCDEAYIDIADIVDCNDISLIETFISDLRLEVLTTINCTVSAGIGRNKLIARMATRKAKPDGQFICLNDEQSYIASQPLDNLPGIGRQIEHKLISNNFNTYSDILQVSQEFLSNLLGLKTGKTIFNFCRGIDDRLFITKHERKSISVEINYGIRLSNVDELSTFLLNLCTELNKRMKNEGIIGSHLMLKMKIRAQGESLEPLKHMGHGICDNINKSTSLPRATCSSQVIHEKAIQLATSCTSIVSDIRGIGIHVSKLSRAKISEGESSKSTVASAPVLCTAFQCSTPSFLGKTDCEEIESILISWVNSQTPLESDVEEVESYLLSLIPYGNISFLEKILSLFYKQISTKKTDEWMAIYNALLNQVQIEIHQVHSAVLDLKFF